MTRLLLGVAVLVLITGCSDEPRNTDPRQGRVVTGASNCLTGSCYYDFKVCIGPDLLVHIDDADPEDRLVRNSPECVDEKDQR